MENEVDSTETAEEKALFALVDISSLDGTAFLKNAQMKQILLWQKVYAMDGKPTKRLDLLHDKTQLQYLYYNTTNEAPPEDITTLTSRCAELATQLPVDNTSVEELQGRIPEDVLQSPSQKRKEETKMAQGSKLEGALDKAAPKTKRVRKTGDEKAAEKAAKLAAKAAVQAAKVAAKAVEKANKLAAKLAAKAAKPVKVKKAKVAKVARGKSAKAKVGDVFTGRYKGVDYSVTAVATEGGKLGYEYDGNVYATRSLAGKAIFAPFGLPPNRSLTLNFAKPDKTANSGSNGEASVSEATEASEATAAATEQPQAEADVATA